MMKRQLSSAGLLLALVAVLWQVAAPRVSAQSSVDCTTTATVASGNTLSAIANQYMGSHGAYREIVDATNAAAAVDPSFATIENAALIRVGWKLCIPVAGAAAQTTASTTPDPEVAGEAEPAEIEPAEIEPAEIEPAEIEPAEIEAAEIEAAEIEAVKAESTQAESATPALSTTEASTTTQTTEQASPSPANVGAPGQAVAAPTPPPLDPSEELHPLMIEWMRQQSYPGSELIIEQTLTPGTNYNRYVTSYQSEGNKIFGLLTVPTGQMPENGWPVILFNHGYIPPEIYRTAERYVAYQAAFARNGYISFKSDYRGHGSSEGLIDPDGPNSGNRHTAYTTDVLNALASLKLRPDVDAERIGMWGHSMGGQITLRAMVVSGEIKAGSLWAGTVADYPTMWDQWEERARTNPDWGRRMRQWREELVGTYGTAEENPTFWAAISPNSYLADLSGPILIQHATGDATVPVAYSDILNAEIEAIGGDVEYFRYEGDDHNLSANLGAALARDVAFFDRYLK